MIFACVVEGELWGNLFSPCSSPQSHGRTQDMAFAQYMLRPSQPGYISRDKTSCVINSLRYLSSSGVSCTCRFLHSALEDQGQEGESLQGGEINSHRCLQGEIGE